MALTVTSRRGLRSVLGRRRDPCVCVCRYCFNQIVSWQDRLPDGLSNIETTDHGFQAGLSLAVDDDDFFGRECPACEQPFKMNADQWQALPDEAEIITCPYCGEQPEDVNDF